MKEGRPVFPWGDTRRYNAHASRIKERYGGRIQKVSVNAGFTCPNRDGTRGTGGCIYCNNDSFTPSYCLEEETIRGQINRGIGFLKKRYKRTSHYIAYFQTYSNTYNPLDELKVIYREALAHPDIEGLAISTRPDCVDPSILDYLADLSRDHFLFLEYGIESCYDRTLKWINRGHTFKETVKAIQMSHDRGIHTTGHLLFGLPGESREEMLAEAGMINELPLQAIKFHQLQVMRYTPLAGIYKEQPELFEFFSLNEYVDFAIGFLERLRPGIAVERLASETPPKYKIAPDWGKIRSDHVQKKIESVMEKRDTWQGKKMNEESGPPTQTIP